MSLQKSLQPGVKESGRIQGGATIGLAPQSTPEAKRGERQLLCLGRKVVLRPQRRKRLVQLFMGRRKSALVAQLKDAIHHVVRGLIHADSALR